MKLLTLCGTLLSASLLGLALAADEEQPVSEVLTKEELVKEELVDKGLVNEVPASEKPLKHTHEADKRTHTHFLANSETPHTHNNLKTLESDEPTESHVSIVTKNIMTYDRAVGSYIKYESKAGDVLLQITFRSKNLETNKTVLGVAEVPVDSCDDKTAGNLYLAYDGFEEGNWYEFKRDETALPIPLAFVDHICGLNVKD